MAVISRSPWYLLLTVFFPSPWPGYPQGPALLRHSRHPLPDHGARHVWSQGGNACCRPIPILPTCCLLLSETLDACRAPIWLHVSCFFSLPPAVVVWIPCDHAFWFLIIWLSCFLSDPLGSSTAAFITIWGPMAAPRSLTVSVAPPVEHREGLRCPLRRDPERGHEVGLLCHQVPPPGRFTLHSDLKATGMFSSTLLQQDSQFAFVFLRKMFQ